MTKRRFHKAGGVDMLWLFAVGLGVVGVGVSTSGECLVPLGLVIMATSTLLYAVQDRGRCHPNRRK
jgi:hypothetical protein